MVITKVFVKKKKHIKSRELFLQKTQPCNTLIENGAHRVRDLVIHEDRQVDTIAKRQQINVPRNKIDASLMCQHNTMDF